MSQIPELTGGRALEHGIAMMVDHGRGGGSKMHVGGQASVQTSATTLTASNAETSISSFAIPANTLVAGSTIRVRAAGIATATNGSDTLTIKVKLDKTATALGSREAILTSSAVDVSNNDIYSLNSIICVRSITVGATEGKAVAISDFKDMDAAADAPENQLKAEFDIDTSVENTLQVTGTFSSDNVGNSMRSDVFVVDIVNPST